MSELQEEDLEQEEQEEQEDSEQEECDIILTSFGYSNGKPEDSSYDKIFRLTNLPNPDLQIRKKYDGRSLELQKSLFEQEGVQAKYDAILEEIITVIENLDEDKDLFFAFGCHSGIHRSVAIVEKLMYDNLLTEILKKHNYALINYHRDVENPPKKVRERKIKSQRRNKEQRNTVIWD